MESGFFPDIIRFEGLSLPPERGGVPRTPRKDGGGVAFRVRSRIFGIRSKRRRIQSKRLRIQRAPI